MNRKERLKEKYAILKNITGDTALSNKAKHWGDQLIFERLNIDVDQYRTTKKATLKPMTIKYRNRLIKSAENKYRYALKNGVSEENAEILKYQPYKIIDLQIKYSLFFKPKHKRFTKVEKYDRIDQWASWGKDETYPPSVSHTARMINLHNNLDINDSYGFGIMFYHFTTNKSIEYLQEQYKADLGSGRIIYKVLGGTK